MPEEFKTSDLVELMLRFVEAANRRDFAAVEAFYAPDVVVRGAQIGTFEGRAAARGLLEDVIAPYEEFVPSFVRPVKFAADISEPLSIRA
jgi:ketosteroid isomerase-like protein